MSKLLVICLTVFIFPAFAFADVIINEIAWMGSPIKAGETANMASNGEWIELYNGGSESVDLSGWRLTAIDGQPDISFGDTCVNATIAAGGYFLLERTDDDSVPGVSADCIYTGALNNTSEHLQLLNISGSVVDSVNATDGWPAGDNTIKETMQRSGNTWITALATPKAVNASIGSSDSSENDSKTDPGGNSSPPNTNNNSQASGADEPYVQPEDLPQIKADAGEDMRAGVGEEVQFYPHAWGLRDEPLENARYLWNFGDGGTKEGQNVGHAYMFPGTYMVRLTVSSGKYTVFDDLRVTVSENTLVVSEVKPGTTGWVEFENKGNGTIHVGGWILETSESRFIIPSGTKIAPQSFVVLSAATTNIFLKETGDHAYFFYPNGSYASGIAYVFQVPEGKSVSNNSEQAGTGVFTEPTPGAPNMVKPPVSPPISQKVAVVTLPSVKQPTGGTKEVALKTETIPVPHDIVQSDVSLDFKAEQETASLADAPPFAKRYRETVWFGGSLVVGGLLAVAAVFFRRRRG